MRLSKDIETVSEAYSWTIPLGLLIPKKISLASLGYDLLLVRYKIKMAYFGPSFLECCEIGLWKAWGLHNHVLSSRNRFVVSIHCLGF